MSLRVFISSVQTEFKAERVALREYLRGDALLSRFFDPFIFEDVPALDRRVDGVYLDEVSNCDIYLGIFGEQYGSEGTDGLSPMHREYNEASRLHKTRLIFIESEDGGSRHGKMQDLVQQVSRDLTWKIFTDVVSLKSAVYASLVKYLGEKQLINVRPFDISPCLGADLKEVDRDGIKDFLREAREKRNFSRPSSTPAEELLAHLNMLDNGVLSNAAILLFGKNPQKYFISSEIKCAHFHGTDVVKPIPSYQVYKGTAFELVDQAVDFVMSKINRRVGTRKEGTSAPVEYEIPREVVAEAVVNAVAHRDYRSNESVQVMLFSDRLEISNPGRLPSTLTIQDLRVAHKSVPANPLLAEVLFQAGYIEKLGTGTKDIVEKYRQLKLKPPQFEVNNGFTLILPRPAPEVTPEVTPQDALEDAHEDTHEVTPEVGKLLVAIKGTMTRIEIQGTLNLSDESNFRKVYLTPALDAGLIEMTLPEKPTSRNQRYRLTAKGKALQAKLSKP